MHLCIYILSSNLGAVSQMPLIFVRKPGSALLMRQLAFFLIYARHKTKVAALASLFLQIKYNHI